MLRRDGRICAQWPLDSPATLDLVDHLARMRLVAKRLGYDATLRDASEELIGLLELAGLTMLLDDVAR